jgi:hypothetical protein
MLFRGEAWQQVPVGVQGLGCAGIPSGCRWIDAQALDQEGLGRLACAAPGTASGRWSRSRTGPASVPATPAAVGGCRRRPAAVACRPGVIITAAEPVVVLAVSHEIALGTGADSSGPGKALRVWDAKVGDWRGTSAVLGSSENVSDLDAAVVRHNRRRYGVSGQVRFDCDERRQPRRPSPGRQRVFIPGMSRLAPSTARTSPGGQSPTTREQDRQQQRSGDLTPQAYLRVSRPSPSRATTSRLSQTTERQPAFRPTGPPDTPTQRRQQIRGSCSRRGWP